MKNNKLILKTQQKCKSKRHNGFAGEINKITLALNGDKRMQLIDWIVTYIPGTSKDLLFNK